MNKDMKVDELLAYVTKIIKHAENLTVDELDDLAAGDGWLALIDDEPEFADYVASLSQEHMMLITEAIMAKVQDIYDSKSNEKTPSTEFDDKQIDLMKCELYGYINRLEAACTNYQDWMDDCKTRLAYSELTNIDNCIKHIDKYLRILKASI